MTKKIEETDGYFHIKPLLDSLSEFEHKGIMNWYEKNIYN